MLRYPRIAAGATSIADRAITDKRADSALCGFVGAVGEGTAVSIAESALASAATAYTVACTAQASANTAQGTADSKEPAFTKNNAFNKNFGSAAGTVCQGNDARLSNARRASNISMSTDGRLWISYS